MERQLEEAKEAEGMISMNNSLLRSRDSADAYQNIIFPFSFLLSPYLFKKIIVNAGI